MITFSQVADLHRRLGNVVRAGKVASVDLASATCRVTIGELLTAPLPFISSKAGDDRTWHPPEVGEQVIVLAPGGELSCGFVLGGVYTTAHPAPSASAEVSKMIYKDGTVATYDRALHSLTLDIPHSGSSLSITVNGNATVHASGNALVEAEGNATLSAGAVGRIEAGTRIDIVAPAVSITSTVTVSGDVTAGGKSLINHVHGGVTGGPSSTNPPA